MISSVGENRVNLCLSENHRNWHNCGGLEIIWVTTDVLMAIPMGADVCIVGLGRTPIGGLNGSLSSIPATKLGSIAIQGACTSVFVVVSLALVALSHAQKPRDSCHEKSGSEVIPGHMVQVHTCDCKVQRSVNEEGWFLVCVHRTPSKHISVVMTTVGVRLVHHWSDEFFWMVIFCRLIIFLLEIHHQFKNCMEIRNFM